MKAAAAHHPIIQKEVDELLSKGAIEPSSGGAGFYSSVFVVPKCMLVDSGPYLTLSSLIVICIYLLLRCLLCDICGNLFSMVIMLSPFIPRNAYLPFLLLSMTISYDLFGTIHHINERFYLLGWLQPLVFSQPPLNLSCSFSIAGVSVLLSIWMTSWSWFTLSEAGKRACSFLLFLIGLPWIAY